MAGCKAAAILVACLAALGAYLESHVISADPGRFRDALFLLGFRLLEPWDGSALSKGQGLDVPSSLADKSVVVTGGTRGVGFHAAVRFHQLGARLIVSGRTTESAARAADSIRGAAGEPSDVIGIPMDLSDFDDVHRFGAAVVESFSAVHFLLLNAGMSHSIAPPAYTAMWDRQWLARSGHSKLYASNHLGHFLLAVLLAPHLAVGASVVVVGSLSMWWGDPAKLMLSHGHPNQAMAGVEVAGRHAAFGERMYEASKLANLCFARSLRAKVGSRGITVIAMTPGQVNTDLNAFVKDLVNVSVPAELGGEKLFESAFVTRKPTPDFVYPYWFPRLVFEGEVPEVLAPWRITEAGSWGRPLDNAFRPERLLQQRDFTLHGSVGPECGEQLQRSLWRWSRAAVGLPERLDAGDLFQASSLQANPSGVGVAKCPSPGLCAPTLRTLPFPEFALPDQDGALVTLESFPSVSLLLYWYPNGSSPDAIAQGSRFEELLPRFRTLKTQVIGVSAEPSLVSKTFAKASSITFPLLSDPAGSLPRALEMNEGSRWACYIGAGRRILRFWPEIDPLHFPANVARELR